MVLAKQGPCISDRHLATTIDRCGVGQVTIDVLPNDVLLHVFDWYMAEARRVESWHTLVHVCQRWRSLVFESSRRLNLRIACTNKMRVREKLDAWLDQIRQCQIPELIRFGKGIERDKSPVQAALQLPYSNGVVEGHVHRLKLLKRQGYGRAAFPLLRKRVLTSL